MITIRRLAAVLIALGAGAAGGLAVVPSAASAAPPSCDAIRYVTHGRVSLDRWTAQHGDTVSDVLGLTFSCSPGWSVALSRYLDRGRLGAPMPDHVVLWALLPGHGP